jgi:spermidine synthase
MRLAFAALFAASGAAALIYEVTWTRLLTLQLGHGIAAASTVLAAFMGGLAVGSATGGRFAANLDPQRALRWYAGLEIAIALLALILPFELDALNPWLARAYANGDGGTLFAALRLGASLVLLALPAAAMGATFPVASRWFVQQAARAGSDAGALYAANTVGAAVGALCAGFLLLPFLGLSGTTWVGVALNVLAAGGAWAISTRASAFFAPVPATAVGAKSRKKGASAPSPPPAAAASPGLAAAALGVSGFASLTLQVVWTRLLAMILGPTTYAFSTIVAVFIAGLAVGAGVASRIVPRVREPMAGLAMCLTLSVGLAAVGAALVDRGLLSIAAVVARPDVTFAQVLSHQAWLALALLAPMTIAFGAAFPFAVAAATREDDTITRDLGVIYAVNTAGAIAGALLSGFLLIPWLGLHGTIRAVIAFGALAAVIILIAGRTRGSSRLIVAGAAVAVFGFSIVLPRWDPLLLSSGAYKYAAVLRGPDLRSSLTAGELLYYGEGASSTVAVRRAGGTISLSIDGKVDASNSGDMLTQRLLAHVPLLLHPDPKRVGILGLGSGVTLGSALRHPIERADVLEISREVAFGARFFDAENHSALSDPRTRLILGDGRTHLLLTRETYDVIVSEPSNPWMAGIASLFTREFFEAARDRLSPGGVLCQWAHTYDISTRDLQSIVATFVSVFPDGTLWLVGDGDVLLVGSNAPLEPRFAQVPAAWKRPGVAEDLASVGATDPMHVLSLFVAQRPELAAWAADAPVQSDNHAALEFSGPQSIFGRTSADNATLLRALAQRAPRPAAVASAMQTATPAVWRDRGWMFYSADAYRPAYDDFVRALAGDPNDVKALDGLLRASAPIDRAADTRTLLTRLAADPTHEPAKLTLARFLAAQDAFDDAVRITFAILQRDPSNVPALQQMASILSDAGDTERLAPVVARLRAEAPGTEDAHYYTATYHFMQNRPDLALPEARRAAELNPRNAKAQNLLGACLASLGDRDTARRAFQASIAADPRDAAAYTNLATLEMQGGNRLAAARYFAEALSIDPESRAARQGLAETVHPN